MRLGIVPVVPVAITTGLQAPRVDTAGLGLLFGDFHESLLDDLGEPGHGVSVDRNTGDEILISMVVGFRERAAAAHSHLFDSDVVEYLKRIKPTNWVTAKTEAIDFSQPFLWFDDDLYPDERVELIRHNALQCWIQVDLQHDLDMLGKLLNTFPAP